MLSDKSTVCPNNLLDLAHQKKGIKVAIANAGKTLPMISVMDAVKEKLIVPVLIGNESEIKKTSEFLDPGIDPFKYNKSFFVGPTIIGSYASLISNEKNRLPQQALTDCTIWRAKFDIIEHLSINNYEIEHLRRKIAEQFFVWNEKKQLEMALLEAKERYLIFKKEHPGIEHLIPQYHIASYLGISPTQLSRIRQKAS